MEDSNNNFIIYQLLKLFPPILLIALLFWKRHALVNAMQALPKLIICALLWAAFAAICTVPFYHFVSHNDYSLLFVAPLAALLGALYYVCFWLLNRRNKATASLLQRGVVAACLGIALTSLLLILLAYSSTNGSFDFSHDRQSKGLFMFFCMIAAAVIIPSTIVLGLLTPRQLLLTQEKGTL
jgi:H+/Cl- antiporter ClcA